MELKGKIMNTVRGTSYPESTPLIEQVRRGLPSVAERRANSVMQAQKTESEYRLEAMGSASRGWRIFFQTVLALGIFYLVLEAVTILFALLLTGVDRQMNYTIYLSDRMRATPFSSIGYWIVPAFCGWLILTFIYAAISGDSNYSRIKGYLVYIAFVLPYVIITSFFYYVLTVYLKL